MESVDNFFKASNPKLYEQRKEGERIYNERIVKMVNESYNEWEERKKQNKINKLKEIHDKK